MENMETFVVNHINDDDLLTTKTTDTETDNTESESEETVSLLESTTETVSKSTSLTMKKPDSIFKVHDEYHDQENVLVDAQNEKKKSANDRYDLRNVRTLLSSLTEARAIERRRDHNAEYQHVKATNPKRYERMLESHKLKHQRQMSRMTEEERLAWRAHKTERAKELRAEKRFAESMNKPSKKIRPPGKKTIAELNDHEKEEQRQMWRAYQREHRKARTTEQREAFNEKIRDDRKKKSCMDDILRSSSNISHSLGQQREKKYKINKDIKKETQKDSSSPVIVNNNSTADQISLSNNNDNILPISTVSLFSDTKTKKIQKHSCEGNSGNSLPSVCNSNSPSDVPSLNSDCDAMITSDVPSLNCDAMITSDVPSLNSDAMATSDVPSLPSESIDCKTGSSESAKKSTRSRTKKLDVVKDGASVLADAERKERVSSLKDVKLDFREKRKGRIKTKKTKAAKDSNLTPEIKKKKELRKGKYQRQMARMSDEERLAWRTNKTQRAKELRVEKRKNRVKKLKPTPQEKPQCQKTIAELNEQEKEERRQMWRDYQREHRNARTPEQRKAYNKRVKETRHGIQKLQ